MIEEANALETFAEVSATIAGFAVLASVLGEDPESRARRYARLRAIVSSNLLIVVVALLPVLFQHLAIAEESMWKLCAGLGLLLTWVSSYHSVRLAVSSGVQMKQKVSYVGFAVMAISQICLLAVGFGIFPDAAGFLYLFFLLGAFAPTAAIFIALLDELFMRPS